MEPGEIRKNQFLEEIFLYVSNNSGPDPIHNYRLAIGCKPAGRKDTNNG